LQELGTMDFPGVAQMTNYLGRRSFATDPFCFRDATFPLD
jgi:hypothetical protein